MTRALLAGALMAVVVVASFVVGAINVIAEETWPDF